MDTIIANANRISGGAPSISGGAPVNVTPRPPSSVETKITSLPTIDSQSAPNVTGIPSQLQKAANWTEKVAHQITTSEPHREEMTLSKKHFIGKLDTGEPIYIPKSPALIKYGYMPPNVEFGLSQHKTQTDIAKFGSDIKTLELQIPIAKSMLPTLRTQLESIRLSPEGTKYQVDFDSDSIYDATMFRSELITRYESDIKKTEELLSYETKIPEYRQTLSEMKTSSNLLGGYQNLGYKVGVTANEYTVAFPTATETHKWLTGEHGATLLSSAAFIESPLAVKTVGSAIWQGITGDKKIGKARIEDLSAYSLGLHDALKHGDFHAKVITSPAMTQGVYLPLATLGLGYGMTSLTSTATRVPISIGSFTASKAGKLLACTSKAGMVVAGGVGIGLTAASLSRTWKNAPEKLPGQLSETLFSFGMAIGGYRQGAKLWKHAHTGSYAYDWGSGKMKWSSKELPKMENIHGVSDVMEYRGTDKSFFTSQGKLKIGGKTVDVRLHGMGERFPGKTDATISHGAGKMSWTEKGFFTKKGYTRFFEFEGGAEGIKLPGYSGKIKIFKSDSFSQLLAGKKGAYGYGKLTGVTGHGKTFLMDLGKPKPGRWQVFPPESMMPSQSKFVYSGTYKGQGLHGKQFQLGRILSFGRSTGTSRGSGSLNLKLDYGTIFKNIGTDVLSSLTTKPTTTFAIPAISTASLLPMRLEGGGTVQKVSSASINIPSYGSMQTVISKQNQISLPKTITMPKQMFISRSSNKQRDSYISNLGFAANINIDNMIKNIVKPVVIPKHDTITDTIKVQQPIVTPMFSFDAVSAQSYKQILGSAQSTSLIPATTTITAMDSVGFPKFVPVVLPYFPLPKLAGSRGTSGWGDWGLRTKYRYREFKIPSLKKLLGG